MDLDRRQFLAGAATVAGVAAIGLAGGTTPAAAGSGDVDASGPFALGLASGDPLPDSVILWTRLVRDPLDPDSLPRRPLLPRLVRRRGRPTWAGPGLVPA